MGSLSEILLPVVVTPGVVICQKVFPGTRYFNFLRSRQKYFNLFKFLNSFTIRILLIGNFYYYLLLVIFNSRIKLKSFFGPTFESELSHQITPVEPSNCESTMGQMVAPMLPVPVRRCLYPRSHFCAQMALTNYRRPSVLITGVLHRRGQFLISRKALQKPNPQCPPRILLFGDRCGGADGHVFECHCFYFIQ